MRRANAPVDVPKERLTRLVYELLDAHDDTMRLTVHPPVDPRWELHLDYLRDLQRAGREVLAQAIEELDAIAYARGCDGDGDSGSGG
jgi:hypothetical protein